MNSRSIFQASLAMFAAAFALASATAVAQPLLVREDSAQLKADQTALQRQLTRLQADEARLKADTASGKMSAESKDAYAVYNAKLAVSGEAKAIAADKSPRQMKADEAALQRQIKRLDAAIARNKADYEDGKMAAESRDAEKIYLDEQLVQTEKKDIAADEAKLADHKKK